MLDAHRETLAVNGFLARLGGGGIGGIGVQAEISRSRRRPETRGRRRVARLHRARRSPPVVETRQKRVQAEHRDPARQPERRARREEYRGLVRLGNRRRERRERRRRARAGVAEIGPSGVARGGRDARRRERNQEKHQLGQRSPAQQVHLREARAQGQRVERVGVLQKCGVSRGRRRAERAPARGERAPVKGERLWGLQRRRERWVRFFSFFVKREQRGSRDRHGAAQAQGHHRKGASL